MGVDCESVLSKHVRSSDPVRYQITVAARNKTRLAWESIKKVFDKERLEVQDNITSGTQELEDDVLDILTIAKLTTAEKL